MLEALGETDHWRFLAGVTLFTILGLVDWKKHPEDPRRAKEYLFLLFAMSLAVLYAVLHDHVTATISPEYFLYGKGLADDARPYRWAVTVLAAHAAYGPGLIAGACLLFANNPSKARPQLPYRELAKIAAIPLACAILAAGAGAAIFPLLDPFGCRETARCLAGRDAGRFMATWGIHSGTYAGATLGTILSVISVRRARKAALPKDELPC